MCDVLSMIGTGLSMAGKISEGETAIDAAQLQGRIAGINLETAQANTKFLTMQADIARSGIDVTDAKARLAEARVRTEGDQTESAQLLHYAGSFLDPTYGSPLLHMARTAGKVQADVELIHAGAAVDRANGLTRVANIEAQAAGAAGQGVTAAGQGLAATMKGTAAGTAAIFGAGTALLQGIKASVTGSSMPSASINSMPDFSGSMFPSFGP